MVTVPATRVVCLGTLIWISGAIAPVPTAGDWRRIDSPNFIVVGDVGEGQLRDVAMQFEGFRDTLSQILAPGATGTAVPTVVIVFPDDRSYTPFKPIFAGKPVLVGGVFYGARDINYITLLGDGRPQSLRVLFHEYAHLVTSNLTRNLPVWLSEGLAEFYSTYEPQGRKVLIGTPIESHISLLNQQPLVPLETLIKVQRDSPLYNEGERRSMFYAQSWALTHLLFMGEPRRTSELSAFLQAMRAGLPEPEAWRKAFGEVRIDRELQQYVRRFSMKAFQIELPQKIVQFKGTVTTLPQPDVQAVLAGLYLRQRRQGDAEKLLAGVLKPGATPAHASAVMAQIQIDRNDLAGATERLMALDATEDWFVRYLAGVALADVIDRGRGQTTADVSAAALGHFAAVARQREVPNALARTASIALSQRDDVAARTAIERARTVAPGREDYAFTHARVLGQQGEFAAARAVILPLILPSNPDYVRNTAQSLLAYLGNLEASRQPRGTRPAGASTPAPPKPEDRATPAPPSGVTPTYRATKAGELRIEGTLDRIECPAKGGPIFHVRVGDVPTPLKATSFDAVDFITYRTDLTGSISCGPLKSPRRVYVTLRVADSGEKLVIAIEFLPDHRLCCLPLYHSINLRSSSAAA